MESVAAPAVALEYVQMQQHFLEEESPLFHAVVVVAVAMLLPKQGRRFFLHFSS